MESHYYLFPIPEIEAMILDYLNKEIDYQQLVSVNKYFHEIIERDLVYPELRRFLKEIYHKRSTRKRSRSQRRVRRGECSTWHNIKYPRIHKFLIESLKHDKLEFAKYVYTTANYVLYLHTDLDSLFCEITQEFLTACHENGNSEIVKWVHGLNDLTIAAEHHNDLFGMCCEKGYLEIAKWLYDKYSPGTINICKLSMQSFMNSCKNGHIDVIRWLCSLDNNIHKRDKYLIRGCYLNKQIELVRWFHSLGGIENETYECAFQSACDGGDLSGIKFLYSLENVNINIHADNERAFRLAARNGHIEVIRYLNSLEKINIHIKNEKIFRYSCSNGRFEVVKYLYSLGGIDIHVQNEFAFRVSCKYGYLELAKWLYSVSLNENNKIDIHIKNENAFRWSCYCSNLEVAKWLYDLDTENRIDLYATGAKNGKCASHKLPKRNALNLACRNNQIEMTKWLWDLYSRPYSKEHLNLIDKLFHYSCRQGNLDMAKLFCSLDNRYRIDGVQIRYTIKN